MYWKTESSTTLSANQFQGNQLIKWLGLADVKVSSAQGKVPIYVGQLTSNALTLGNELVKISAEDTVLFFRGVTLEEYKRLSSLELGFEIPSQVSSSKMLDEDWPGDILALPESLQGLYVTPQQIQFIREQFLPGVDSKDSKQFEGVVGLMELKELSKKVKFPNHDLGNPRNKRKGKGKHVAKDVDDVDDDIGGCSVESSCIPPSKSANSEVPPYRTFTRWYHLRGVEGSHRIADVAMQLCEVSGIASENTLKLQKEYSRELASMASMDPDDNTVIEAAKLLMRPLFGVSVVATETPGKRYLPKKYLCSKLYFHQSLRRLPAPMHWDFRSQHCAKDKCRHF